MESQVGLRFKFYIKKTGGVTEATTPHDGSVEMKQEVRQHGKRHENLSAF